MKSIGVFVLVAASLPSFAQTVISPGTVNQVAGPGSASVVAPGQLKKDFGVSPKYTAPGQVKKEFPSRFDASIHAQLPRSCASTERMNRL